MQAAIIAGIDEAGRGALAGPVVAAACILPLRARHDLLRDSKQLSPEQREEAYTWIKTHCQFGVGMAEASVVDLIGIIAATEQAMQAAVRALSAQCAPTYLLVDGRDHFWFDVPHSSIVRGDQLEPCISAASIVAKVERDHLMVNMSKKFVQYTFEHHKGYGTPQHWQQLLDHGLSAIHRHTFITRFLNQESASFAPPKRTELRLLEGVES